MSNFTISDHISLAKQIRLCATGQCFITAHTPSRVTSTASRMKNIQVTTKQGRMILGDSDVLINVTVVTVVRTSRLLPTHPIS